MKNSQIYKSKTKNLYGEYNIQIDIGETQIQIIGPSKKTLNSYLDIIKKALKEIE